MGSQMVTSEFRKKIHARFVKILIIYLAFRLEKLKDFDKNASKIISQFHEYII